LKTDLDTLKRIGQKPKDSILPTLIYRKISIRITRVLLPTSITPNQITILAFLTALAASSLFFLGDYFFVLGGAVILQFREIFDCVDGELARIKGLQSPGGALLDAILDGVAHIFVFMALAFGIYNVHGSFWVWPIALLCISGTLNSSFTDCKLDTLKIPISSSNRLSQMIASSRFSIGWGGGANEFVILLGAVFNQMIPALIAIALFSNAYWITRLLINFKRASR
jgi:phosphatidylglycerophosphate synthase